MAEETEATIQQPDLQRQRFRAEQDADLDVETVMEKALFIAATGFFESDIDKKWLEEDIIKSMEAANQFIFKYDMDNIDLLNEIETVIIDSSNGELSLEALRAEFNEVRKHLLKRALELGFGRRAEPSYPWEVKLASQAQVPMTKELIRFLSSRKGK